MRCVNLQGTSDNRRRLLDWKNENKTIQFGNRHQCIASRGISGTA